MATVRLNEHIRQSVLKKLMEHAFAEEQKLLDRDLERLAVEVYNDIYPADLQRKMRRLPANFFDTDASIAVAMGGQVVHLKVPKCPVAYVHYHSGYTPAKTYAASHPFSERHDELYRRRKDLEERSATARKHAYSVLTSCATCKQLVEVWPEVEPFVSPFTKASSPQSVALMVPVKELNRQFGLGG